jgi:tetratricopeptide (TPR) repeat protein
MFELLQGIKPALDEWRADQLEIDKLVGPWRAAMEILAGLQQQVQQVQAQLNFLAVKALGVNQDQLFLQQQAQNLQCQLAVLARQIGLVQEQLIKIDDRVKQLRLAQARLAVQADASMGAWVRLCDVPGRLGRAAHEKSIAVFDQWLADDPRLWQPYLGRGVAQLHAGHPEHAVADLARFAEKMQIYDSRPRVLACATAIQAYGLYESGDLRNGAKQFDIAKKIDRTSSAPYFYSGWSKLDRRAYCAAMTDFQGALQHSKQAPQAETHEAMALLLAAGPDNLRNGSQAKEHAKTACGLTKRGDWTCWLYLDTLAAACAETGDFDAAVRWARKSLDSAPEDSRDSISQRVDLYGKQRPLRLK